MQPQCAKKRGRYLGILALAALALANAGCLAVAAGAAAGAGVAGYAYYKGSVSRDYAASFEQTWAAAQGALADLAMPVNSVERADGRGTIETKTPEGWKAVVTVEGPVTTPGGAVTRVTMRVGVFGDHPVSERFLDQVQGRLPAAGPPAAPCPGAHVAAPAETGPPPLAAPK
jgi:hypothetical protein